MIQLAANKNNKKRQNKITKKKDKIRCMNMVARDLWVVVRYLFIGSSQNSKFDYLEK